jgi:hypothetical protein
VRIQHVIASRIDPNVEEPEARADRLADGNVAAIWEFETQDEESDCLAQWIEREVQENWSAALLDLQFLQAVDPADETGQQLVRLVDPLKIFGRGCHCVIPNW